MTASVSRPLTKRQQAVMERIDRRVPIKIIARELGVSETRINQHIRALKNIYQATSLNDLVECYRAGSSGSQTRKANGGVKRYSNKQAVPGGAAEDKQFGGNSGDVALREANLPGRLAPWKQAQQPMASARARNGDSANHLPVSALAVLSLSILLAVALALPASMAIGAALAGKAYVASDPFQLAR